MASVEQLLTGLEDSRNQQTTWRATSINTHAAVQATRNAVASARNIILGFIVSVSADPTIAQTVKIVDGVTTRREFQLPAVSFSPIIYDLKHPIVCDVNASCNINVGDLGVGVVCRVELWGITDPV